MNYAHDFHAGNFADVFKHIFLTRILLYLQQKPGALRYIETHGGAGLYDLAGAEAEQTAEWRGGVLRLFRAPLDPEAHGLIEPYLRVVAPLVEADPPRYPGSPMIAQALLRPQDRMIACELHPRIFQRLKANLRSGPRAKAVEIDGYAALKAYVPPPERRGLVLIDPPFEDAGEFAHLLEALPGAARKWASGVFVLWHPVKDCTATNSFAKTLSGQLAQAGIRSVLRLELQIGEVLPRGALTRCGLIIANPPYTLEAEARIILPALVERLSDGRAVHLIDGLSRA